MKRIVTVAVLAIAAISSVPLLHAQTGPAYSIRNGTSDPAHCQPQAQNIFFNRTTGKLRLCTALDTLTDVGGSGTVTNFVLGTIGSLFTASVATSTTTPTLSLDITNQGTVSTVLHGNAAGHPSFGSVVNADMNVTAVTCTNQFIRAISSSLGFTCASIAAGDLPATVATSSNNLSFFSATTSAQLAALLSDETGSGAVVFATSPSLTTPNIGAATAASINGNTITSGTFTLTGGASKTLTFNNSLTLAGTDGTAMTFPTTSATVARTDAAQSFTGVQTFANQIIGTGTSRYLIDIYGGILHVAAADGDIGAYITSASAGGFTISGGVTNVSGTFTAKAANASIIQSASGALTFYNDTGLTAGNTYTPTNRFQIDSGGNAILATGALIGVDNSTTTTIGNSTHRVITYVAREITGASTPTTSVAAGFCTSPSAAVDTGSSDRSGIINITAGSSCGAATGSITVTFSTGNGAYGTNTPVCVFQPIDGTSAYDTGVTWKITAISTTAATVAIKNGGTNWTSAGGYKLGYSCIGK